MTVPGDDARGVDVVIVNWNAGDQLRACIRSLAASANAADLHVIVVDNASADGSVVRLPGDGLVLTVLANRTNLGFGRACNQGAAAGRGGTLLFLNPDTEVSRDAIPRALTALRSVSNAGIVGARLVDGAGTTHRTCARTPTARGLVANATMLDRLMPHLTHQHFMTDWDHADSRPVDAVMGAFLMIPRPLFEGLGGFDERYFVYFEDADLCVRVLAGGRSVNHAADAVVLHRGQGTTAQVKDRRLFYFLRSQVLYTQKHHGRVAALAVLAGACLGQIPIRILHALARRSPGEAAAVLRSGRMLVGATPRLLAAGNCG
ncbi:MAG: glycosyltransferase family 2 protein [Methylobacterium sp.]